MSDVVVIPMLTRTDWFVIVALILATLAYLEWALARRFARHEAVEAKQYAALALTAETAAGVASVGTRHLRELREEVENVKAEIREATEKLIRHEGRLDAMERRYMRPALLYPTPPTPESE